MMMLVKANQRSLGECKGSLRLCLVCLLLKTALDIRLELKDTRERGQVQE